MEEMNYKHILYNGVEIPAICYGTGISRLFIKKNKLIQSLINSIERYITRIKNKDFYAIKFDLYLKKVIKIAPKYNCNLFDTSRAYADSEEILGKELAKYNRKDFFIVTKLSNRSQFTGQVNECFNESLKALNLEYIDLYLQHWPVSLPPLSDDDLFKDNIPLFVYNWKQMEKLYKEGKCRAIGVCNYNIRHLEILKKHAEIMPMVNQFECHPLFIQEDLIDYCKKNNIVIMAYTSIGRMNDKLKCGELPKIAKKHNVTIPQVILRWHIQRGIIPIFNTTKKERFIQMMDVFNFSIDDADMKKISDYNQNLRLRYDPDNCDFTKL